MRAKSSSSSSSGNDSIEYLENLKEPHLSGAYYIRSLVKQITSATNKDLSEEENGFLSVEQDPTRKPTTISGEQPKNPPHKKRARRRRTQTSKPYQERLLNMAEARREIVAALKIHRKAREKKAGPELRPESSVRVISSEKEMNYNNPRNYSWPVSYADNFALPSQTLGLNLNLQDFDVFRYSAANPSSSHDSSSPPPPPFAAAEAVGFGRSLELPPAVDFVDSPFDEVMEFPGWMSTAEEKSCLQSVNDFFPDESYFQDRALPCMEIEEIGGMDDGDWLA